MKIRKIGRRFWPRTWVFDAMVGDLLLFTDQIGKGGGILKIRSYGAFITLTEDQVWRRHPVSWPFSDGRILRFTIIGLNAEFILQ